MGDEALLRVRNLVTSFRTDRGTVRAVDGVSFDVPVAGTLGIVGESGCGKSVTSLSIMRLVPAPAGRIESGEIWLRDQNLVQLSEREMQRLRGYKISMVFQEPMTSLNPVYTVGAQVMEVVRLHRPVSRREARARAVEMFQLVGIPSPETRVDAYPHQLSGGMRQRVMIAMALACEPDLLIADEPTTALDVTIQAQILDLLRRLQEKLRMSVILISHDLGVIAEFAQHMVVMYAGKVVEAGPVPSLFARPMHPYTQGLLRSLPRLGQARRASATSATNARPRRLPTIEGMLPDLANLPPGCRFEERCSVREDRCRASEPDLTSVATGDRTSRCFFAEQVGGVVELTLPAALPAEPSEQLLAAKKTRPLLQVEKLAKFFPVRTSMFGGVKFLRAVDGVSLYLRRGETLGLVGESGCGKSTLGRSILRLVEPTYGRIVYDGKDVTPMSGPELRALRRKMQIIFQDPYSSLNPRLTVRQTIGEAIQIHKLAQSKADEEAMTAELLRKVGLRPDSMGRYPHEFSGGQRQRIGIARALAVRPEFIVCDEPISALDVSIQAQIVNLLQDLQDELGLSFLFISHDLKIIEYLSHRVAVMYLGKVVETAASQDLFEKRYHPYTRALLSAIPEPDPARRRLRVVLEGDVPSALDPPTGCAFHPRCPKAQKGKCDVDTPELTELLPGSNHRVACFFPET